MFNTWVVLFLLWYYIIAFLVHRSHRHQKRYISSNYFIIFKQTFNFIIFESQHFLWDLILYLLYRNDLNEISLMSLNRIIIIFIK